MSHVRLLPLRDGGVALVDADVLVWAKRYVWKLSDWGYVTKGDGRALHRMVLGLEPGDKRQGDHKNGNKRDCQRNNLRIVTLAQNKQNLRPRRMYDGKPPASQYRGVFRHGKRWLVQHYLDRKCYYGGIYDTEEEANEVAIEWRKQHMPFTTN